MTEERDLPAQGTAEPIAAPTFDEQVAGLSDLLEDPATDHPEEKREPAAEETEDDPLALAEDVDEATDTTVEDGPEDAEIKGGRFAPDTAKVQFNGETITIRDLKSHVDKRVKDFQRGFTEKTTALKARESEVDQYVQSLSERRDYLEWYAGQYVPKQPEPFKGNAATDPVGWGIWQQQQQAWVDHVTAYQAFQQQKEADNQRKTGETQAQARERIARESEALRTAIPALKDPAKAKALWETLTTGAVKNYGFTEEEAGGISDHRMVLVLRDALAYRQLKAKAPQVREEVTKRPVAPAARRQDPRAQGNRDRVARSERLRQTGSMEDAIAALQDLPL